MNKLLYTSALCAFSVLMGANAAKAVDFPDRYRTLDVHAEYTKQTDNFTVKNVFPFQFPDDLPGIPVLKGIDGQLSTTTEPTLDENGQEKTFSETLFNVEFLTKTCPKAGDGILSLDTAYGSDNHIRLTGGIIKQTKGGETKVLPIHFMNQYDTVLDNTNKGCGIVYFDGSDFQNKPYTMKADLNLKYTFQPIEMQIGGEFVIDVDTYQPTARWNAYVVHPVASGAGKGSHGVFRPGTLFAFKGNSTASGVSLNTKGNWSVRYITAVYKNNSCNVGLRDNVFGQDTSRRFQAQDEAGIGSAPNPTSALWPTATIISDITLVGHDRDSVVGQVNSQNLPIHIEDGDCVVQAMLPQGQSTTGKGSSVNVETVTQAYYIPD